MPDEEFYQFCQTPKMRDEQVCIALDRGPVDRAVYFGSRVVCGGMEAIGADIIRAPLCQGGFGLYYFQGVVFWALVIGSVVMLIKRVRAKRVGGG